MDERVVPQASIDQLKADYDALLAENERLRAALEAVEWVEGDDPHNDEYDVCPWCEAWMRSGHVSDCQRQLALRRTDETTL